MVANGMFGLTEMKDQLKCKTAVSMVMAGKDIVVHEDEGMIRSAGDSIW